MSYTYTVPVGYKNFEVTIRCNQDMYDYHLEYVTLNGEDFDPEGLYIKGFLNTYVELEEYLVQMSYDKLSEDGGVVYKDGLAAAEHRMDCEREEG